MRAAEGNGPSGVRAVWYPLTGFECPRESLELPCELGNAEISLIARSELEEMFREYPVKGSGDEQLLPAGRHFKLVLESTTTCIPAQDLFEFGDLVVSALRLFRNGFVDAPVCSFRYAGGDGGGHSTPSRAATAWHQRKTYQLTAPDWDRFVVHWNAIRARYSSTLDWRGDCVLTAPMRRFILSYDERPFEDIFLDRWMALEMLLHPGAKSPKDFFRRLRLALLLSEDAAERQRIFLKLAELADVRGKIVHRGHRMHYADDTLGQLTEYLRRALVVYSEIADSTGRQELHEINNALDDRILLGALDLPLSRNI